MGHMNVVIGDEYFSQFRELKLLLNCRTNDETIEKLIKNAYQDLKKEEI